MEWSTLVNEDHKESPTAHGQSLQGKMEVWFIHLFCTRFLSSKDLVFSFNTEIKLPWAPEFCFLHHVQIERETATTRRNARFKVTVFSAYIYKFSEQPSVYDNVI